MPPPFSAGDATPGRRAPALGDARRAAPRYARRARRRQRQPPRPAGAAGPLGGPAPPPAAPGAATRSSPAGCSRPTGRSPSRSPSGRRRLAASKEPPPAGVAARARRAHRHRRRLGRAGRPSTTRCSTASPSTTRWPTSPRWRRTASTRTCASYVVAGWWSDAGADPLDAARSNDSLHELLDRLRWRLLYEWGDAQVGPRAGQGRVRAAEGARPDHRRSAGRARGRRRSRRRARSRLDGAALRPMDKAFTTKQEMVAVVGVRHRRRRAVRGAGLAPALVAAARRGVRRAGRPATRRRSSSGADGGARRARPARRRRARRARLGAGRHARRSVATTERLLGAFTSQKVNRLRVARRPRRAGGARARRRVRLAAGRLGRHRPLPAAGADRRRRRANKIGTRAHDAVKDADGNRAPATPPPAPRRRDPPPKPGSTPPISMQWTERKPDLILATATAGATRSPGRASATCSRRPRRGSSIGRPPASRSRTIRWSPSAARRAACATAATAAARPTASSPAAGPPT